jgi:PIN domain nuclease of toxin-antitoxin system
MNCILDSSSLLAALRHEPGAAVVRDLLRNPANTCFVHAVNLCEVYYIMRRTDGEASAQAAIQDLLVGIVLREDMDAAFWQDAGRIKADHRRVSLADCFCIALARRLGGELITADHHEFDALVPLGLCPIRFIR